MSEEYDAESGISKDLESAVSEAANAAASLLGKASDEPQEGIQGQQGGQAAVSVAQEMPEEQPDAILQELVNSTVQMLQPEEVTGHSEDDVNESEASTDKENEDEEKVELTQAIAEALKANFPEIEEDVVDEDVDREGSSSKKRVANALEAAELDFNREIEDALKGTAGVGAGLSQRRASRSSGDVEDAVQDAIYAAFGDINGEKKQQQQQQQQQQQRQRQRQQKEQESLESHESQHQQAGKSGQKGQHKNGPSTPPSSAQLALTDAIDAALLSPLHKEREQPQSKHQHHAIADSLKRARGQMDVAKGADRSALEEALAQVAENVVETNEKEAEWRQDAEGDMKDDNNLFSVYRNLMKEKDQGMGDSTGLMRRHQMEPIPYKGSRRVPGVTDEGVAMKGKDSGKRPFTVGQQGILESILSSFEVSDLSPAEIFGRLGGERVHEVQKSIDHFIAESAVDNSTPSKMPGQMSESERRKYENRERKKRWREINFERNRDNDLRTRVLKRAEHLYPNPEQHDMREQWARTEFLKRKQKRFLREKDQLEELLGIRYSGLQPNNSISVTATLKDESFQQHVAAVCNQLGDSIEPDQLKPATCDRMLANRAMSTAMLTAYMANAEQFDDNKISAIAGPVVSCLNNILGHYSAHESRKRGGTLISGGGGMPNSSQMISRIGSNESYRQKMMSRSMQPTVDQQLTSSQMTSSQKKPKKNRKSKYEPVDFAKFLSPHPPTASFLSMLKSGTLPQKRSSSSDEGQSSPQPDVKREQTIAAGTVNLDYMRPSPDSPGVVALSHYKSKRPSKVVSISPRPLSAPSTLKQGATGADEAGGVPKRPGYYGLRKPSAFKKPQGFKDNRLEGIRKPFYGIVPQRD